MYRAAVLASLLACHASSTSTSTPPAPPNTVEIIPAAPTVRQPLQPGDNQLVVSLRHTACFGQCPVYSVELYASGLVCWNGERCGIDIPANELRVPAAEVERVIAAFTAAGFLDVAAGRTSMTATAHCDDLPGAILTFSHGGETATLEDAHCNLPPAIHALEGLVDEVTGAKPSATTTGGLR